ncbi:MAG TPA: hypothetical protein DDY53_04155 [Clostridiales bacterium]|nr:hypothetical protein [Clostridiales bacterium]
MMILSQNGKAIASTSNLNYIEVEEKKLKYKDYKYTITAYYTKDHKLLGEYKTANRANEILLDIYKQIMIQNFSFTYKMPKE